MPAKQSYHHGDLANALLEAADEVLHEVGLQGFTLRACARKAGVSHAAPKHHFGDVRGLLGAVAERGFARLVTALREALAEVYGDLDEEMYATVRSYVEFAEHNPEHFRIMFRADLLGVDDSHQYPAARQTFTELTNVIRRQRGEPELSVQDMDKNRSDELLNDILLGWCHIHGYAHLRMERQLDMISPQQHSQQMRRAALRLGHLIRGLPA